MKLSKEKSDRILLISIFAVAICFGLWHLVIKSRTSQIVSDQARLAQAEQELANAVSWIERAQEVQAALEAATAELQEREEKLASPLDTFAWSRVLLDQARSEFPIEIVDVTRPQVGPMRSLPAFPYRAATFTVSGRAHYHHFGQFLADFENRHPFFRVENIELSRRSPTGPETPVSASETELLSFKMDIVALMRPTTQ
jgi:hypothetical protein